MSTPPPSRQQVDGTIDFHANQEPAVVPKPPHRPLLVAAVALIVFLAGLVWITVGIAGLLSAHGYPSVDVARYLGPIPSFVSLGSTSSALVQAVIGVAIALVAVGLWRLSQLALAVTLVFLFVEIVLYGYAREFGIPLLVAVILFLALIGLSGSFN